MISRISVGAGRTRLHQLLGLDVSQMRHMISGTNPLRQEKNEAEPEEPVILSYSEFVESQRKLGKK